MAKVRNAAGAKGNGELMKRLNGVLGEAAKQLKARQRPDGHWIFDLEADATMPAEYIMIEHFLDEIDEEVEAELANYLREKQRDDGSWAQFHGGDADLTATVRGYFALRLVGDATDAPHMVKAREMVHSLGGAEKANVFTRYWFALYGQVPWRAAPMMPVELMLMPKWFPINVWRMSYWSRTVIAPLTIIAAIRPRARNPKGVKVDELFTVPPFEVKDYNHGSRGGWSRFFIGLDKLLRVAEPYFPRAPRERAIKAAIDYFESRLYGDDGLGGILPAMGAALLAMDALGYSRDDPRYVTALQALRKLVSRDGKGSAICQACLSPVWDTSLAAHALLEAGEAPRGAAMDRAGDWLTERQIMDVAGDWAIQRPGVRPGGWAFQYRNDHFPDVDDTAVVGMMLDRMGDPKYRESIDRAAEWIVGMQSSNGGWGAFDAENESMYLNYIPFADHGALLDPPTEDVTARCVSFLTQIGYERSHPVIERGIDYLIRTQEPDGSWYGRWGTNYIYGTWSSLCAFNMAGEDFEAPHVRRGVEFLLSRQRADGGWGEDCDTYVEDRRDACKASTASQTAWALLGLMAAGEVDHPAVERGIEYLVNAEREGDKWQEPWYTAIGFPRVFYLRYDGYSRFFPVWALARYRNLKQSNSREVAYGM